MESISVKNYRSIVDSGEIELRPLTVVLGKNSAGKSSFIRLLPLLKQTLERKISDPLLWYGDYVDFGDFYSTVSRKNSSSPIDISFSLFVHNRARKRYLKKKDDDEYLVNVSLSVREKFIETISINFFDQYILLKMDKDGNAKIILNEDESLFSKKTLRVFNETGSIIPSVYEIAQNGNNHFYIGMRVSDFVSYCRRNIYAEQIDNISSVQLFDDIDIPITSKSEILEELKRINPQKFKAYKIDQRRFQKINDYIIGSKIPMIIDIVNTAVLEELQQTSYLKPIRAMVNRYYRVQGISIEELDADGSNIPMILRNMTHSELRRFEQWSKEKFGVVFSVTQGEGHTSLVIKNDISGDIITNVADTGYGYSQMLPIVVLMWMIHRKNIVYYNKRKTIVIEQPELHLHPAYQAKMIDVFASVINEAKSIGLEIKIVFETHSETMVNRIGELVSKRLIDENSVSVLIFEKENDQTHVVKKSFNEDGLLTGWPIGFFATGEN